MIDCGPGSGVFVSTVGAFCFVTEGGEPSFSSAGKKIVYEVYVPPYLHTTEIFTMKVGGGGKLLLRIAA